MRAVVDGFEGSKARLEEIGTRRLVVVSRSSLPKDAGEGSVVDNGSGAWKLDNEEAARRRKLASDLVNSLLK